MKNKSPLIIRNSILALLSTAGLAQAVILEFDLSPAGTSAGVGFRPANNIPAVTNASTGSGNEISNGISYHTDTNTLSIALGYGLAAGFTNLNGVATGIHIHGPAAATVSGPQLFD